MNDENWRIQRKKFNRLLIINGFVAFCLYVIIIDQIVIPKDPDIEITIFTTIFQGISYLFYMGIANILFSIFKKVYINYEIAQKRRIFRVITIAIIFFPFLIPISVFIIGVCF